MWGVAEVGCCSGQGQSASAGLRLVVHWGLWDGASGEVSVCRGHGAGLAVASSPGAHRGRWAGGQETLFPAAAGEKGPKAVKKGGTRGLCAGGCQGRELTVAGASTPDSFS